MTVVPLAIIRCTSSNHNYLDSARGSLLGAYKHFEIPPSPSQRAAIHIPLQTHQPICANNPSASSTKSLCPHPPTTARTIIHAPTRIPSCISPTPLPSAPIRPVPTCQMMTLIHVFARERRSDVWSAVKSASRKSRQAKHQRA